LSKKEKEMDLNSLKSVYIAQLKDMYSAEKQLTEALPKMAEAASSTNLEKAFRNHLEQTEEHLAVVAALLNELNQNPTSSKCKAMKGLIEEGEEIIKENGDADARDAALIVAAQKVEHYEIATYGGLRTFASTLGDKDSADILQNILDQEYVADQLLDDLAMGLHGRNSINKKATN
jgi:ferritin-like metal-binding protein YciE